MEETFTIKQFAYDNEITVQKARRQVLSLVSSGTVEAVGKAPSSTRGVKPTAYRFVRVDGAETAAE